MKSTKLFGAALLMSTMLAVGSAQAKSLVYCSEGSPENFTPAMNTTGTSLDAARPVYNKLVQFTPGSTAVEPGLAESYEVSDDGTDHHLPSAQGRQVPFRRQRLHADPRPQRRRRDLVLRAPVEARPSLCKGLRRRL